MTPLRAAILLALEQVCSAKIRILDKSMDDYSTLVFGGGAWAPNIWARVRYDGVVHRSSLRVILLDEFAAGRVLRHTVRGRVYWWPVGLAAKLAR